MQPRGIGGSITRIALRRVERHRPAVGTGNPLGDGGCIRHGNVRASSGQGDVSACARPHDRPMRIGSSLFLIAVGAILYFAVTATLVGIDIQTVGLILMVIGVIGFALSLVLSNRAGSGSRDYYS